MLNPYTHATPNNNVYYLGADDALRRDLGAIIKQKGLKLTSFETPATLASVAETDPPAVLILDMDQVPVDSTVERFLNDLILGAEQRPELICIAEEENIATRLQAMRAGAHGFYLAPVSAQDVALKVVQISGIAAGNRPRILVVEDEPAQAKYIALLLTNAGMDARVVAEPLKILEFLKSFRPDLILMDLYMPDANGLELTAIIREHDDFFDIPIIFLSSEKDLDKQLDALRVGGDSFIAKPVHRKQLIGAIEHRIRMNRWLQDRRSSISRRDTATGLLQKDYFMRHLDRSIRNGSVQGDGCGLLVIELDAPQHILDRLGINGTEKLLRHLEVQISNHMTPEESAARLGDFAYAVLVRREDAARLTAVAERFRVILSDNRSFADGKPIQATASVGIGLFSPPADDAITMISRAQKATTAARQAGGNRVNRWEPAVNPQRARDSDQVIRGLIENAIAHNGLMLLFQPIVSLGQDAGELYEVQLRLRAPDGEHIPPADFLPVAESHGQLQAIDRWVLKHALDVVDVQRVMHPRLRFLVHQSVATVASSHWLMWYRDQIVQRNLIRLRPLLQFQIRDVRQNLDVARTLIPNLLKYGIQVCVANVSGAPSEVQLLTELGVTLAKLSFHTLSNTEQQELTALIQLLREHGTAVIAAGIEDPDAIARVWSCRPDFIQGNYLQMPSPELSFDFSQAEHF